MYALPPRSNYVEGPPPQTGNNYVERLWKDWHIGNSWILKINIFPAVSLQAEKKLPILELVNLILVYIAFSINKLHRVCPILLYM